MDKWLGEREALMPRLEAIFAEHSKQYSLPLRDGLRTIATTALVVRNKHDAKDDDPSIVAARKASKDLLRNLKPIKKRLEVRIADAEAWGQSDAGYREPLDRLDGAANAVEALLIELDRPPIAAIRHKEPIKFVSDKVQEVWSEANNGAAPTGKGAGDPLVKVVAAIMPLCGVHISEHTVSSVLKNRRRTRVQK